MEIKINIEKKHLYFLTALVVLLGALMVVAQNTSKPNPGHSGDEIGEGTIANTLTISGGKVGIGTTNPLTELDVNGMIYARALGKTRCGWTDWFRSENENSPQYAPDGAYIAGIDYKATTGGNDGVIRFYYCYPGY